MKLLVYAITPPPHHGQSHMVQLMLEGFGGDLRKAKQAQSARLPIQCYHVNARSAPDMQDMGSFRIQKGIRLLRYLAEAIWCRFRYGADVLYYCPAHPLKATLIRDIVSLLVLRPFFRRRIFYWHASGLGEWLESGAVGGTFSKLGFIALGKADLALTPAEFNLTDLRKFSPKRSFAVPYGIPDPCPDFAADILPRRRKQLAARRDSAADAPVKLLYMALCAEEKGLIDTVKALHLVKGRAPALKFSLTVAGKFLNSEEEANFWKLIKQLGLESDVSYAGFISGEEKNRLLAESDLFCFPTYFCGESFGVVIVEAMAYGLPIVTKRWRTIPEFFAPDYPGLVDIKRPDQIADAILAMLQLDVADQFRKQFLENFTIERHLENLRNAFLSLDAQAREPHLKLADEVVPSGSSVGR